MAIIDTAKTRDLIILRLFGEEELHRSMNTDPAEQLTLWFTTSWMHRRFLQCKAPEWLARHRYDNVPLPGRTMRSFGNWLNALAEDDYLDKIVESRGHYGRTALWRLTPKGREAMERGYNPMKNLREEMNPQ